MSNIRRMEVIDIGAGTLMEDGLYMVEVFLADADERITLKIIGELGQPMLSVGSFLNVSQEALEHYKQNEADAPREFNETS